MDPFRAEDPARVLERLRTKNAALRAELTELEQLEHAQRDGWWRWGETPAAAERAISWTVILGMCLAIAVGSCGIGMMARVVPCPIGARVK